MNAIRSVVASAAAQRGTRATRIDRA